ncbi:MAG: mechanosensitive ion channel [Acidobacteria bacterium]|nr:MAG: mechanosensitive ion channel [Acidobacteriota bacterium]
MRSHFIRSSTTSPRIGGLTPDHARIRSSRVRTYAGATIIVPNADLISAQVVNWSLHDDQRRAAIPVGVAYGTQPQKVTDLLLEVAAHHPEVYDEPAPIAIFHDFGVDALEFQLLVWMGNDRWFRVSGELRTAITLALTEAGIEIPFPQRDLHIRSIDDSVSLPEKGPSEG